MITFFSFVLLICGMFYGVSYWQIVRAFRGRAGLKLVLAAVAVVLVLMPFAGMMLERRGHFALAWPLATIGFIALVGAGWFCLLSLVADLWNGIMQLIGRAVRPGRGGEGSVSSGQPPLRWALLPPKWTVIALGVIVAVGLTVSVVSALNVQPKDIVIPVPRLPAGLPEGQNELVVAQVSDLHLGLNERGFRMRQVIDILERVKPDVILFTGDMIDSPLEHVDEYAEAFTSLQAPLGKYAVLGNHEWYVASLDSLEGVEDWYRRAGFRLLRQESVRPVAGLFVAGVDDPGRGRIPPRHSNERAALAGAKPDDLVLFLIHKPLHDGDEGLWVGQTMVQFSGHTHGGQIWPWHYVTATQFPMLRGLYDFSLGRHVYVNPGAGTWGPPVRLFASPEVTIMRFQKSQ